MTKKLTCTSCKKSFEYEELLVPLGGSALGRCPCCGADVGSSEGENQENSEMISEPTESKKNNGDNGGSITFKINSKFIAAIIVAILGFGWNKLESCSNQKIQYGVGDKMFGHFQQQIRKLRADNAACHDAITSLQAQIDSLLSESASVTDKHKPNTHHIKTSAPNSLGRGAPPDFDTDTIKNEDLTSSKSEPSSYEDLIQEVQMEQKILPTK